MLMFLALATFTVSSCFLFYSLWFLRAVCSSRSLLFLTKDADWFLNKLTNWKWFRFLRWWARFQTLSDLIPALQAWHRGAMPPPQEPFPTIALPPDSLPQLLITWHGLPRHSSSPISHHLLVPAHYYTPRFPRLYTLNSLVRNRNGQSGGSKGNRHVMDRRNFCWRETSCRPEQRRRIPNDILMTGRVGKGISPAGAEGSGRKTSRE